ncbi:MAG: HAMP domain-containing histidine kinase [Ktedonobacteraceae bacterium]|nr:HAMP domain-containing histidine kinase [Ktedonobacteraceae bacterium]
MKRAMHHIWPPGVRLQLMLWYISVFMVLLLFSDVILYTQMHTTLVNSLNTALQLRVQQIASGITHHGDTLTIQDVTGDLSGSDSIKTDFPDTSGDIEFGTLVRVLNGKGRTIRISSAFHVLQVPPESITQPLHGSDWQGDIMTGDGQSVHLYSMALTDRGMTFAIVQVGEALTQFNRTLQNMLLEFLIIIPIVLVLGAIGSYWLAARAFAPIGRLTRTTRHIQEGNLQQRVPLPRAHDEVFALAQTLNEMIERLEESFTRQRRFVADASHELRTPIAAIRSIADLALAKELAPQEYVNLLNTIHTEAERMGHLISDLLALARSDEGKTQLEYEPVRLDLLVQAVVANAEVLANERGITTHVHAQKAITIPADEVRLIQAVMNLLDNAILYTNAGGEVSITLEEKCTRVFLSVHDTGIGITPEHLPHIFERFYRVDQARARTEGNSSGLGLAIVAWTVKAHHGLINVESEPGRGSTFTIILPLAESGEMSLSSSSHKRSL